jgi:hypothetical protein
MKTKIEIDDVHLRSYIDHNTMNTAVVAQLSDTIVRNVSNVVVDRMIVEFFAGYSPLDVRDIIRMCMEDKEIQEKVIAMKARHRILDDSERMMGE